MYSDKVRFYVDAPVCSSDPRLLGTLCIIDCRLRTRTDEEQRTLALLVALVSQTLIVRYHCLGYA